MIVFHFDFTEWTMKAKDETWKINAMWKNSLWWMTSNTYFDLINIKGPQKQMEYLPNVLFIILFIKTRMVIVYPWARVSLM